MDVPSEKIWTINKSNLELALSKINLGADAEVDIRNAVNAGKIATAHETQINFNGWIGEGYTLIDPNTGAGAYMISGGGNGGLYMFLGFMIIFGVMMSIAGTGGVATLFLAPLFLAGLTLILRGLELITAGTHHDTASALFCSWTQNVASMVIASLVGLLTLTGLGAVVGIGVLDFILAGASPLLFPCVGPIND